MHLGSVEKITSNLLSTYHFLNKVGCLHNCVVYLLVLPDPHEGMFDTEITVLHETVLGREQQVFFFFEAAAFFHLMKRKDSSS